MVFGIWYTNIKQFVLEFACVICIPQLPASSLNASLSKKKKSPWEV